ncbi:hypothetical protein KC19_6G037900 [Ceratodon purpureus]|uniref:Homeobox domain-containing protein n=1 Tax=Ceratodon purpureus TaxID=3225 RepID=A0A8T0HHL6_CERPU|nr:hypothetical protein KC19_6G037900 [Ceratodon purpureus]
MAVASLGPYGGVQNLMLMPMRNDQNADTLVAMLGSCSPHISLQQVSRSMGGGLEDVSCAGMGAKKRPYSFSPYSDGPALVDEPSEDGDDGADEFSQHVEKKRRLSFDQVRSLERNFEVENKLEPERKMQLAKELGLQPRQVAVWFQNRRARWKIKQLERDYEALTQDYNRLQADLDAVTRDKDSLRAQVNRLKGITTTEDDANPVESVQCRSDHPASPAQSDRSDIDDPARNSPSPRTSPSVDPPRSAMPESAAAGPVKRTASSDSINCSGVVTDADSPCTSDSGRSNQTQPEQLAAMEPESSAGPSWAQYAQFPPESFVGPNLMPELCAADDQADLVASFQAHHRGGGVKVEDMDHAFLLSRLEEQPVLPNWWEWA